MNDTSPQIAAKLREMILQKLPEERLRMGCSMFDFSKKLVMVGISRKNPYASRVILRIELFRKFYGNDFSRIQQEKIIAHLVRNSSQ